MKVDIGLTASKFRERTARAKHLEAAIELMLDVTREERARDASSRSQVALSASVEADELISHLTAGGCRLLREGSRHSVWVNPATGEQEPVPRHAGIKEQLAKKICRALPVPNPPG